MDTVNFFCSAPPNWFVYASGFASVIALLFVILYFLKPCLKITDDSNSANNIRIKCINKNLLPFTIKDIQCDIVASKDDSFEYTDTLELHKNWIAGIRYHDNYIFKVKNSTSIVIDKKFIKVRILAINVLGVKKYYQRVFKIKK